MGIKLDMVGLKYGRLTVISRYGVDKSRHVKWLCICDCGKEKIIDGGKLRTGNATSCGCYPLEFFSLHGMSYKPIYRKWSAMKTRCSNKNSTDYKHYGGRGITVCDEWIKSFESFMEWATINKYSDELELDRIDNNKGYSPENCRFVTRLNNANNKRNTIIVEINGVKKPLMEWGREYGINRGTLYGRLRKGITGLDLVCPPFQIKVRERGD